MSLAWGFTVNKVQDLSLPRGIIIFDIHLQKPLNQGPEAEKYEKKSIDKIYLIGTYFSSVTTANKDTHVEYGRLPKDSLLRPLQLPNVTEINMLLSYLNTRLLKKHSGDRYLLQSGILCLTEAHPIPDENADGFIAQFGENLN